MDGMDGPRIFLENTHLVSFLTGARAGGGQVILNELTGGGQVI